MKHGILAASILLIAACGGDEPTHKGMINATGARTSVESVHDVFAALDTGNGESAADAVMALTAAGQVVVVPGEARTMPAEAILPASWPRSKISSFTGSADCDDSGCTFVNFGDDSEYGSYRINGSIRKTGDVLAFDLTYDITADGIEFRWEMDGNVRANATLIDGYVRSHGDAKIVADGETYEIGWDFDIDYDNIILDGGGCPVGGALAATVAYDVAGAGSFRASGSVRFGPSCGQVVAN
jgi:hypothetical protein